MTAALVVSAPGAIGLEDRPALEAKPGITIVSPRVVGLCGTDLEIIDGAIDPAYVSYPLVLGHEWAGVVTQSLEPTIEIGQSVVVVGIMPCRSCAFCVAGDTNLCETYNEIGFTHDGAAAGEIAVRHDLVHRLNPDVDPVQGAFVEPAAVVYRALGKSGIRPGLDCLVVGDGTVALLAVHLLQLWSPATTTVLGRRQEQATLAKLAGATDFVSSVTPSSFGFVIEAAGTPSAVEAALAAAARGATVVLLGLPPHGSTVAIEPADLVNSDLSIVASFGYTSVAWRQVVALVNSGRLAPGFLVTHRFPLTEYERALETLRHPEPGEARGKVVLDLVE